MNLLLLSVLLLAFLFLLSLSPCLRLSFSLLSVLLLAFLFWLSHSPYLPFIIISSSTSLSLLAFPISLSPSPFHYYQSFYLSFSSCFPSLPISAPLLPSGQIELSVIGASVAIGHVYLNDNVGGSCCRLQKVSRRTVARLIA